MFNIIKGVAKHSIIYGIGDVLGKGIGFFMIPLYTYYLSTSDYGTLELLDLTSYVVSMFLGLGISQSVIRYYYEYDDEEKKKQVISVAMITIWIVSLIILIWLFFFSKEISYLVFNSVDYFRLFNIMFATVVFQLSNEIPRAFMRIEQKSVLYVFVNIVKLLLALSLNIIFIVYFKMGVMGILISSLISTVMTGFFFIVYIFRRIRLSYSFELLFAMLKYGLPIMWSWFGMFILHFGDRFILQRLTSLSDVGIYSLAYKFGFIPNLLVLGPFLLIWAPKRFELIKEPNAKDIYAVIFTYLMFVNIFVSLGMAILIKDVITLISDPKFHGAYQYVPTILLAYLFFGAFQYVQFGVHVEKKTKYLAYTTLLAAGLNIGANILLIPKIQVWGASLVTLISLLFLLVFIYFPSQKLYHIPYEFGRIIKMSLTALALYFMASLVNPSHIVVSLMVKLGIAISFPFVLYLTRFYKSQELAKLAEIRGQIYLLLKEKAGSRVTRAFGLFRRNRP